MFGWIVLGIVGLQAMTAWFILLVNHGGQWTIGGATNSISTRITVIVIGALIALYFYWLYTICPFTVTLS